MKLSGKKAQYLDRTGGRGLEWAGPTEGGV